MADSREASPRSYGLASRADEPDRARLPCVGYACAPPMPVPVSDLFHVTVVRPPRYPAAEGLRVTADVLAAALRCAGCRTAVGENAFVHDATNVILGAHLLEAAVVPTLPPDTIVFNTEPLDESAPYVMALAPFVRRFEVWDYTARHLPRLRALGNRRAVVVEPGYVPDLLPILKRSDPDVDVLFYGEMSSHRAAILHAIESTGAKVVWLHHVYGRARDDWIARAKLVLNAHYRPGAPLELGRIVHLMSNRCAVLCEADTLDEIAPDLQPGLALATSAGLPRLATVLLADPRAREALGERALACIRRRDYVQNVRRALERRNSAHIDADAPSAGA